MNCFNHPHEAALCLCGNCCKGLCITCMRPSSGKFACSEECQEAINQACTLNQAAIKIYGLDKNKGPRALGSRTSFIYLAFGFLFLGYGLYKWLFSSPDFSEISIFTLLLGAVFSFLGYRTYKGGLRL